MWDRVRVFVVWVSIRTLRWKQLVRHAEKVPLKALAKAYDDWWVESRPEDHLGRVATRTHQQGGGKLHGSSSVWLPTWLWLPVVVTPSICSYFVHLQVCFSSRPQQTGCFRSHQWATSKLRYPWRQHSERGDMEFILVKQQNCVVFRCTSTKRGGRLYILLFTSCEKFHAEISTRCWNVNKISRGLVCVHHFRTVIRPWGFCIVYFTLVDFWRQLNRPAAELDGLMLLSISCRALLRLLVGQTFNQTAK